MSKLKNQLNDITSGNKTPASIVALERESKKAEKEVGILQRQYDELMDLLESKQADALSLKGNISDEAYSTLTSSIKKLETETDNLAVKLDNAKEKSANLSRTLETAKLNPKNSKEVGELNAKIELTSSKLETSKNKANDLKNQLNSSFNLKNNLGNELNKISGKMSLLGSKVKSIFAKNNGMNSFGKKIDDLGKKVNHFGKRISNLILSAFVFNVLSSGLSKLSQGLMSTLNSNNQFSSSLNQIKANLLTAFTPIYNYILPAINTLMSALTSVTGQIATFISGLFGQTASQAKQNAKSLYDQAKAYDSVGKSAKEAEGNTASFDNLEVIGGNDSSGGSSSGSSGTPDFNTEVQQSGKLLDFLNQIKSLVSSGDFFGVGKLLANNVNDVLGNINVVAFTDKIHEILQGTVQVFNGFVNGLDWGLLGTKFSQLMVGLTGAIADAIKAVDWTTLGKGISDFLANIDLSQMVINFVSIFTNSIIGLANMIIAIDWKMVGQKLGNAIKDGLNTILTAIGDIDWEAVGKSIGDFIFSIDWLGIAIKLLQILAEGISAGYDIIIGLVKSLIDAILNIDWGELGKNIVDLIVVGLELLADYVFGIFTKAIQFVLNIDWKSVGTNILNWIQQGLQGFNEWIENLFNKALNGIKKIFSGIGAWFKNTVWENGIKAAFSSVTSWFQNTFSKAWTAVKNVFSSGGKIFDGIKDGILSTFKTVVNGIIGGINKVITIPFNGINNALSRIKNISILGNKPFNGLINTISVPQIPMLAKGAVIPPNAKFLAMLGDQRNGNNLEGPESLFRKIVREESGEKEVIFNGTFVVQCGDIELGKASLKGLRLMEEQNGKKYLVN